jgi:hypothetical protein
MKTAPEWYEVIECDNAVDDPYISDSGDLCGVEEWQLRNGQPLLKWDPSSWIQCTDENTDGIPDDALQNHLGIPIFSKDLTAIVQDFKLARVQFLPIRVLRNSGDEIPGYSVANILSVSPAMDLSESTYDIFPLDYFLPVRRGQISAVYDMVLRGSCLLGHNLVRVQQFLPALFASGKFKHEFERERLTGYSFRPIRVT